MRSHPADDRLFGTAESGLTASFLSSPRAHAACAREFARIATDVTDRLAAAQLAVGGEIPTVRLAPNRCIVQCGPVALTVTWLCGAGDSVVGGELLAIVWNGTIAPRGDPIPERPRAGRATAPVALWESTFKPVAGDAASWAWQNIASTDLALTSSALALLCVEQIEQARLNASPLAAMVSTLKSPPA
jgi:hypothetical protein